jgi:DNA-binding FadR family transcriptional regulator
MGKLTLLEQVQELQTPVERGSVRENVADKLAGLIAGGILQVGDTLPSERDLASAFRVSRVTVRGGIQILATRGILGVSHGSRTRVLSAEVGPVPTVRRRKLIDAYDVHQVHAARLLLEQHVAREAALHITPESVALLEELIRVQRTAPDDPVRFLISDREFHLLIYRSCGNAVLCDFVSDLYTYSMANRRRAIAEPGAILQSCNEHAEILEGLRAHDPAATTRAFGHHLERIYDTTIRIQELKQAAEA